MNDSYNASKWFVYILRCADDTLYTGVTTDVLRRVREHNGELAGKGAKYTSARRPVRLSYSEPALNRSTAQMREFVVRSLSRKAKEELVAKNTSSQHNLNLITSKETA